MGRVNFGVFIQIVDDRDSSMTCYVPAEYKLRIRRRLLAIFSGMFD
jgi:hypothetical protein